MLEALLFASPEPLTLAELGRVLPRLSEAELREGLEHLEEAYDREDRGLTLLKEAGGYRLYTKAGHARLIEDLYRSKKKDRLSRQGVETLAIIAFKQPITAPEIQAIRGVDPTGSLKTLLEKGLIKITGRKAVVGKPYLYGTTRQFLSYFGLDSLEDLPRPPESQLPQPDLQADLEREGQQTLPTSAPAPAVPDDPGPPPPPEAETHQDPDQ